jgi:hypothetical protein
MLADDPESWKRMEIQRSHGWAWRHVPSPGFAVNSVNENTASVRLKPRTIRIGGYDVPAPLREGPECNAVFYIVDSNADAGYIESRWRNTAIDYLWLRRGRLHTTKEAAQLHARAIVEQAGGTFDPEE